jgi:hypothetical protein
MKRRVQIVLAILAVAALTVLVREILRFREPVYQGKRLSVWLTQYGTNHWSARGGEAEKQAANAIRHIGTNAIPIYLEMMTTRESPLKLKLMALVPRGWLARFHLRSVYNDRLLGDYGLIALGVDARSSVPALIALLNDTNPDVRYAAVFALRSLGPVAGESLPSLIKCLKDPEFTVQSDAILALGEIHQEPERVIPILVEFLAQPQNPQYSVAIHGNAMWSLRQFGAQAKPAVPMLLGYLNDPEESIRSTATNTLRQIDPEALVNASVKQR